MTTSTPLEERRSKVLVPAEKKLIVAADFRPRKRHDRQWIHDQVIALARILRGTGVCIKLESALDACGHSIIGEVRTSPGIPDVFSGTVDVFADTKYSGIASTLAAKGMILSDFYPEFATVMCTSDVGAMRAFKAGLPKTKVLGVTVLTGLTPVHIFETYGYPTKEVVRFNAQFARDADLNGVVCSAQEIGEARDIVGDDMLVVTPGIRPSWHSVEGDDQRRTMTPAEAIKAGADYIVVGRPIVQAQSPRAAVLRLIEEIKTATAKTT